MEPTLPRGDDTVSTAVERMIRDLARGRPVEGRRRALVELMMLGRRATRALPAVLELLDDGESEICNKAAEAVLYLGPTDEVLAAWAERLAAANVDVEKTAGVLARQGRHGVRSLVRLLKSPSAATRFVAAQALKRIFRLPADVLDTVLDSLVERSTWNTPADDSKLFGVDRRLIVFRHFEDPVAAVARGLEHRAVELRRLAAQIACENMRPPPAEMFSVLAALCADADAGVREYATHAVAQIAEANPEFRDEALRLVRRAADDDDAEVRRRAYYAIVGSLKPDDEAELLRRIVAREESEEIRGAIERRLEELQIDPGARAEELIDRIRRSEASGDSLLAAHLLRKNHPAEAAAGIEAVIERMATETNSTVRGYYARSLAQFDASHPALLRLLDDPDPHVRMATLQGMDEAGAPLDAFSAAIDRLIEDQDMNIAMHAAELRLKSTGDIEAFVDFHFRRLADAPLLGCKERQLFNDPELDWLRPFWTSSISRLVEAAATSAEAAAWIARGIDERDVPKVQKGRLEWTLFGSADSAFRSDRGEFQIVWPNNFEEAVATAELLWRMGPAAAGDLPGVCERLDDRYYVYRLHALQILGRMGPAAEPVLGELVRMLAHGRPGDPDDAEPRITAEVADEAARAIGRICPELAGFTRQLRLIAANRDVARTLPATGERSPAEWKEVLRDAALRYGAEEEGASTDDPTDVDAPPIVAAQVEDLLRLTGEGRAELRQGAASALAKLRPAPPRVVATLAELLAADPSRAVRDAAIRGLAAQGARGIEPIRPLLAHDDWVVRIEAAEALARCGLSENKQPLVYDLLEGVDGRSAEHRRRRIAAAARRRIVDRISELLASAWRERFVAEPQRRLLAPLAALADEPWHFRDVALWQLGKFGPAAEPFVPLLIDALDDADDGAFMAAFRVLEQHWADDSRFLAAVRRRAESEAGTLRQRYATEFIENLRGSS